MIITEILHTATFVFITIPYLSFPCRHKHFKSMHWTCRPIAHIMSSFAQNEIVFRRTLLPGEPPLCMYLKCHGILVVKEASRMHALADSDVLAKIDVVAVQLASALFWIWHLVNRYSWREVSWRTGAKAASVRDPLFFQSFGSHADQNEMFTRPFPGRAVRQRGGCQNFKSGCFFFFVPS